jgi:hypothetical protein
MCLKNKQYNLSEGNVRNQIKPITVGQRPTASPPPPRPKNKQYNVSFEPISLSVHRTETPQLLADKITPIKATSMEDIEYIQKQDIEIYDPRKIFRGENDNEPTVVQIRRVIYSAPKEPRNTINIRYVHEVEVVKEYSYDEWDNFQTLDAPTTLKGRGF